MTNQLEHNGELVESRAAGGWVVDGHGDVRCESVCIENGIQFFDCIEFNNRFRCGDVAGEIAFLAMDLDALGRPDLGYFATERYAAHSGDTNLFRLLPLYRCYRAFVRGKVLGFRLDEQEFTSAEKQLAATRAAAYFDLALHYASPLTQRTIIVVSGLSGTGKTAVARGIASELGGRTLSTDSIRKDLFGAAKTQARFGEGAYSDSANERTDDALVKLARTQVISDCLTVVEGTFLKQWQRAKVEQLARESRANLRAIECWTPSEIALQRIEKRNSNQDGFSDATREIYLRQLEEDGVAKWEQHPLALDTQSEIASCVRNATKWLREKDIAT